MNFQALAPSARVAQSVDVAIRGRAIRTAINPRILAIPNPDSILTVWSMAGMY